MCKKFKKEIAWGSLGSLVLLGAVGLYSRLNAGEEETGMTLSENFTQLLSLRTEEQKGNSLKIIIGVAVVLVGLAIGIYFCMCGSKKKTSQTGKG